jgi:hypothetical protein
MDAENNPENAHCHPLLPLLLHLHQIGSREDEKRGSAAPALPSTTPHTIAAAAAHSPAHVTLSALLPPQSPPPRPSYFALYARERQRRLAALLV